MNALTDGPRPQRRESGAARLADRDVRVARREPGGLVRRRPGPSRQRLAEPPPHRTHPVGLESPPTTPSTAPPRDRRSAVQAKAKPSWQAKSTCSGSFAYTATADLSLEPSGFIFAVVTILEGSLADSDHVVICVEDLGGAEERPVASKAHASNSFDDALSHRDRKARCQ
jgi:hypothetical protein